MPQAESLSVNSDKQSDMFQRVGDHVGIASGVQELIAWALPLVQFEEP
jgi:hypothetical protein